MTAQRSDNVMCWYNGALVGAWLALLSALLGSFGVLAYIIYYRCVGSWADGVLAVINVLTDPKKLTTKFGNLKLIFILDNIFPPYLFPSTIKPQEFLLNKF